MRIVLQNITKDFSTGVKKKTSMLFLIKSFLSGWSFVKKWRALNNVSFFVEDKELVGVIGENGSGKSTLLRIIAGIYPCYEGSLTVRGKVISLIGLGMGLNMRLTVRDNVFILQSLFDISRNETKKRMKSILSFAELEDYIDEDLYKLSSGMIQRLFFSVAINSDPKILLLDEVFEVGDENFKKKSQAAIKEIIKNGGCAILVSHDLDLIEKNCNRVIWLRSGQLVKEGEPHKIIQEYKGL